MERCEAQELKMKTRGYRRAGGRVGDESVGIEKSVRSGVSDQGNDLPLEASGDGGAPELGMVCEDIFVWTNQWE
jgi:hypothetical protein